MAITLSLAWQNRLLWLLTEAHAEGLLLGQEGVPVVRLESVGGGT